MATRRIDTAGTPSKINGFDTTLAEDASAVVTDMVTPTPPATSFAQAVSDILNGLNDKAYIVVCPNARKIYAATGAGAITLQAAVDAKFGDSYRINVAPNHNQTGVSLEWDDPDVGDDVQDETIAALNALVASAKPRRSVASLVAGILGTPYPDNMEVPGFVVDQNTGKVGVLAFGSNEGVNEEAKVVTALEAVSGKANMIGIGLTGAETEVTTPATRLIFEGGDTGS